MSQSVADQVRAIVDEAQRSAEQIRSDVEAAAQRRAAEIVAEAEADAAWIRREAELRASKYLEDTSRSLDATAEERRSEMQGLGDDLVASGRSLLGRVQEAEALQRALEDLARQLAAQADQVAATARAPLPTPDALPVGSTPRPPTFTGAPARPVIAPRPQFTEKPGAPIAPRAADRPAEPALPQRYFGDPVVEPPTFQGGHDGVA